MNSDDPGILRDTPANDGWRDAERAIGELAERLPEPLMPLARLAYNYCWSWMADGGAVFEHIDPGYWRRSGCNPRSVIESVPPRRLVELSGQPDYVARVHALQDAVETYLRRPLPVLPPPLGAIRPVAYFCSEFGVHCSLPIYGGGLGVLAGDMLKTASDVGVPMVGVGLLYREGYFHQRLDTSGWQHEYWLAADFERLPAVLVSGPERRPLTVSVAIRNRTVQIQVWRIEVGRVPLYLLDTDREDNHPIDRWITAQLYIGDRHTRLAQYAVLGIGGVRMLDALGIRPALVHLNEGHAALGSFERMAALLGRGEPIEEAIAGVRAETVFTTHTPVAAGNEGYGQEEVEPVLRDFIDRSGIPRDTFYNLGRVVPGNEQEPVNITPLALRMSRAANGVSRRHGAVARSMWQPLWRDRAIEDVPIAHVTNGVHVFTWMAGEMQGLLDRHLGPDWREGRSDPGVWERVANIPDEELWAVRTALRQRFIEYVREKSMRDRVARGETPDYVESAARVFDPAAFTMGFARRVATYKRLYLLTRVPERDREILGDRARPVQLVVAGKAHPRDDEAKGTLRGLFQMKREPGVASRVVFLEDYDLYMAPRIVSGVDLWLNLPRPPMEASGTSGMKAALNGGINLSVLDGWWAEAYDGTNGWGVASPDADPNTQDDQDARAVLDLLQTEIIPMFYDRDGGGIPRRWLQRVKRSMASLIPQFTAERMLGDYVEEIYRRS